MNSNAGILLVEDHPLMRSGIRTLVNDADGFQVVAEAATLAEAAAQLHRPDVSIMLLDLSLPDGTGISFLPRIRRERPDIRVVILTMHNESPYLAHAIEQGAFAYVVKDMAPERLISALRGVLRGEKVFFSSGAGGGAGSTTAASPQQPLSPREEKVKNLLIQGMSLTKIAAELELSVKTVFTYRVRLLKKMGMQSNDELIRAYAPSIPRLKDIDP